MTSYRSKRSYLSTTSVYAQHSTPNVRSFLLAQPSCTREAAKAHPSARNMGATSAKEAKPDGKCACGVIGLGVMGSQLVLNLAEKTKRRIAGVDLKAENVVIKTGGKDVMAGSAFNKQPSGAMR